MHNKNIKLNEKFINTSKVYSDGDIEEFLLEQFKQHDSKSVIKKYKNSKNWFLKLTNPKNYFPN